jgi:hypothetical protein
LIFIPLCLLGWFASLPTILYTQPFSAAGGLDPSTAIFSDFDRPLYRFYGRGAGTFLMLEWPMRTAASAVGQTIDNNEQEMSHA